MKHLSTVVIVLTATSGLLADDWRGFRGIEKDGRHEEAAGPLNWSSSQNVAWKTAIPGRGHSSPIVSGDAVYLTTTYETPRFSRSIWNYAILALTLIFTMAGIILAEQKLQAGYRKKGRAWQHIRFFLFTQILVAVIVVVLFGRHLFSLDDDATRSWLISTVVVLSCLVLGSLLVPLKSRHQLAVGLLSSAFIVPAFIALKRNGIVVSLGSLKELIIAGALVSPLVLGLALLTGHVTSRKRQSAVTKSQDDARDDHPVMWHFMMTGSMGFVAALAPFFLYLYRVAGYQMPDAFVWNNRVRPDANWVGVGLWLVLVLVTIAGCRWKPAGNNLGGRFCAQRLFLSLTLILGTAFFTRANLVEKPKEFIRAVVCLNRNSGEVLWTCEGLIGKARGRSRTVTYASATPVTDGKRIYAYFGEDGLMCVNQDGKLLWKKTDPLFRGQFGVGTSPVVKDGILIIVSDVEESDVSCSSITAFDCATGERLWKKERTSHEEYAAYGTPLTKTLNGKQVVIVHGWQDVKGYDLKTGRELWSFPMIHEGKHLVASLVLDAERLYVTGPEGIRALHLSQLETGSDPLGWFTAIVGEKSSTPVVIDGLLFLVTETGIAFCLDARTGEIFWKKRLRGRYFSSAVSSGNQVLFTSESGQTTIVAAGKEFRQLARNALHESVYASIAPAQDELLVRTTKHLYCIKKNAQRESP
ncbi:MAG: PQQ-binding-like beta-propeller repeat protein [Planctomycetota bacterium]|nr:PQQ-binding-like beta-propeller repeat protein [Planctomycetota bacterium]